MIEKFTDDLYRRVEYFVHSAIRKFEATGTPHSKLQLYIPAYFFRLLIHSAALSHTGVSRMLHSHPAPTCVIQGITALPGYENAVVVAAGEWMSYDDILPPQKLDIETLKC